MGIEVNMYYTKSRGIEKGQSMVEFAVSAIVILLLLVAIADFGRAFFTYLALRDAAQEGAVYASVCPMDVSGIQTRIRSAGSGTVDLSASSPVTWKCQYIYDVVDNGAIDEADEPYFPDCFDSSNPDPSYYPIPGHGVRVQVEYPNFPITTPLLGSIIGQSLTLKAEVTDTILVLGDCP